MMITAAPRAPKSDEKTISEPVNVAVNSCGVVGAFSYAATKRNSEIDPIMYFVGGRKRSGHLCAVSAGRSLRRVSRNIVAHKWLFGDVVLEGMKSLVFLTCKEDWNIEPMPWDSEVSGPAFVVLSVLRVSPGEV